MRKEILIAFNVMLSGCSLLPTPKEVPPVYMLKGASLPPSSGVKTPLVVYCPRTETSLDTHRMAITLLPHHREYIENAQWSDHLPKIVQEVLLNSLEERWGGTVIHRKEDNLETSYGLLSEIQDFSVYPLKGGATDVRIKMNFKLVDFPQRRVIAAKTVQEVIPLKVFSVNAIVGAFNQGLHKTVQEIVNWIEKQNLKSSNP